MNSEVTFYKVGIIEKPTLKKSLKIIKGPFYVLVHPNDEGSWMCTPYETEEELINGLTKLVEKFPDIKIRPPYGFGRCEDVGGLRYCYSRQSESYYQNTLPEKVGEHVTR